MSNEPLRDNDLTNASEMEFTNAPNILTLIRILLVPLVILLLYQKTFFFDLAAAVVFGVAAITDYFDGYLARRLKLITIYGKLMDPLADKFLVVSSLCMLQELGRVHVIIVILLICRELAITGLRALASSEGLIIAASDSAKWKTTMQMIAIPALMIHETRFGIPFQLLGEIFILISLAISLWSAQSYIFGFFKAINERRKIKSKIKKLEKKLKKRA